MRTLNASFKICYYNLLKNLTLFDLPLETNILVRATFTGVVNDHSVLLFRVSLCNIFCWTLMKSGPGSSVGIATDYGLNARGSNPVGVRFSARPDRPWGPPSLLYNGYRVFPGGKVRPGRAAAHSPPSSAVVMEE
jgi:hypothetical protein